MQSRLRSGNRLAAAMLAAFVLTSAPARAEEAVDPDAATVLKSMSDYLGGLKAFTVSYDIDLETVTYSGQKLQFSSSGDLALERPGKLSATRKGMVTDGGIVLDGTTATLYRNGGRAYFQMPATSIDAAVDTLRNDMEFEAPGLDFLYSKPFDLDTMDVDSGEHVGMAVVGGVQVHHLAFRGHQVDWQLWVTDGPKALPVKYVITSKWIAGAPEYVLRLHDWNTEPSIDAAKFSYAAPAGATKLELLPVDETGDLSTDGDE